MIKQDIVRINEIDQLREIQEALLKDIRKHPDHEDEKSMAFDLIENDIKSLVACQRISMAHAAKSREIVIKYQKKGILA